MWERQKLNYIDELADKRAGVKAITGRLKKPADGKGGYGSEHMRFAKQQRLQILQQRVVCLEGRRNQTLATASPIPMQVRLKQRRDRLLTVKAEHKQKRLVTAPEVL